jgi:hypothetical protein
MTEFSHDSPRTLQCDSDNQGAPSLASCRMQDRASLQDLAEAYALGQLAPAAEDAFAVHLNRCPECGPEGKRMIAFAVGMRAACRKWESERMPRT